MDLLKKAYEDDSEEENSCCDYFGLEDTSDAELQPFVEQELAYLKSTTSLHENSFILNPCQYGPDNTDFFNVNLPKNSYKQTIAPESKQLEHKDQDFQLKVAIPTGQVTSNAEAANDARFWDAMLKPTIDNSNSGACTVPKRCLFKLKLSDKALPSVQWNSTFCHLVLSVSLDGSIRVCDFLGRRELARFPVHSKGARAAVWSLDGRQAFSAGYDCVANLLDLETGKEVFSCVQEKPITSCQVHPVLGNVYLTGSFDKVCAWDARTNAQLPTRTYASSCKQVLCIAFLPGDHEFVCSTEVVSRDSADRAIMAWDFSSGALLSNQIYQERFVCPWICVDHCGNRFFAQSNGDYIAEFSAGRPYKMNKYRRYEGHKTGGFSMGCCLNKDATLLATGDVGSGGLYVYQVGSAKVVRKAVDCPGSNGSSPVVSLDWAEGPALAVTTWDGQLQFWT